jgi:hypothetical protein
MRFAQSAKDCVRRVFEGDRELENLEDNEGFHLSGAWEPRADRNYCLYRSLTPETSDDLD